MPEYLVNYRTDSGQLLSVHICNVDDETTAIQLANNSLLSDEVCNFESIENYDPIDFDF